MVRFGMWISVLLFSLSNSAQGQSFGLQSLFNPGLRLAATNAFDAPISDSLNFGMTKYHMGLVIPLNSNVSFDLKKLKAGLNASFLTLNGGIRDVRMDQLLQNQYVYNFTTGITGVKAGTGKGIWGYTANIGLVQDLQFSSSNNLFFIGGIARLKIHGIHKQNYYGLLVTYGGKRFLPVPIFGLRRKLFDKAHINVLLPVQVDIDYKPAKNIKIVLKSGLGGFSNSTKIDTAASIFNSLKSDEALLSFINLTNSMSVRYKASKQFTIIAEGGVYAPAQVAIQSTSREEIFQPDYNLFPFARLELRFSLGKSAIGSHLFGNDF